MVLDLAHAKELIGSAHDAIVGLAALAGGLWAVARLKRERSDEAAVTIDFSAKTSALPDNPASLVFLSVMLKNVGKTKIQAKREKTNGLAFQDKGETLAHACSLQVKRVRPRAHMPHRCLDWFKSDSLEAVANLPEVNLLSEYENPDQNDEIDFWMEPGEVYELGKALVLGPGIYIGKITFVASKSDEDFWTRIVQFSVPTP
jgi:hypothetical protein